MLPIDESIGYLEKGTDMQSSERGTRRENRRQGEGKRLSLTKASMAPGSPQLKFGKLAAKLRETRQCRRASVLSAILSRSTCMPEQGRTRGYPG